MSLSIPAEVSTALVAISIKAGLAGTGYRLTIATGTHVRVTASAQYREFQRVVEIQDFVAVPRRPGKNRAESPKQ